MRLTHASAALMQQIFGLERDYLQSTYPQYLVASQTHSQFSYDTVEGRPDVVRSMIDHAGEGMPLLMFTYFLLLARVLTRAAPGSAI